MVLELLELCDPNELILLIKYLNSVLNKFHWPPKRLQQEITISSHKKVSSDKSLNNWTHIRNVS